MRATSEAVEGNRVRLSVEVEEPEVDKVLGEAVRTLARQARVPGFRPGKVPRQVLEARMGGAVALRAEALREAIPDFYAQALAEAEVDPISAPEIDITAGRETGALAFDALIEVRPTVTIPGYAGLRVTVPSPVPTDADVDAQIDRLRDTEAELVEVSRPARDRDHVTIDVHATRKEGGEEVLSTDDFLYEVGSGRVVPDLDDQLRGAKPGDVLSFAVPSPTGSEAAGTPDEGTDGTDERDEIEFRVLVKEVKEKQLPEASDEWASEASEFSTLAELREDIRSRIAQVKVVQAQFAHREGAMSALAELVEDEAVPDVLVEQELQQRLHDLGHRLEQQRVGLGQLLEATGRTQDELIDEVRSESRQAVKGDLALRALAAAENLEATDEEIEAEIGAMADRLQLTPAAVKERLTRAGRMGAVRSERRKAKALTWLLDHVELVDEEGAPVSRDDLRGAESTEAMDTGAADTGATGSDTDTHDELQEAEA